MFSPKFKYISSSQKAIESQTGSIKKESSYSKSSSVGYTFYEQIIQTIEISNEIKWIISMPRGEKALRDFLQGNLYLSAEFEFINGSKKNGKIIIRPSDISFFDSDRRKINSKKSLFMHFLLYKKGIDIFNIDGFIVNFKEHGK